MKTSTWLAALFKSIDTKNTQAFADFLAGDVLFRFGNAPAVKGRKAVAETVRGFFQSIRGLHHELTQIWIQEDAIICHGQVTYTRIDGSILSVPFANIFTLSGDVVSRYLIFVDLSELYASPVK
ncbi:MAG: nuclear transport factor 2 family protein [Gammaproteobacteria bacterium]